MANYIFIQTVDEFKHYIKRGALVGMFHVGVFNEDDELSWELVKSTKIDDEYGNLEFVSLMCGHSEGSYVHGDSLPIPSKEVMDFYADPNIPMPWWSDELLERYENGFEAARRRRGYYDPKEEHLWGNTGEFPEGGVLFVSPELGKLNRCILNRE
jgi:hypothetical protein|tara:strand:+ start:295 stop:759 length:465 start_codon:yes stop_codon:yes gene_type:complete